MKSGRIPILGRALTLRPKKCTDQKKAASLTFPGTIRIKKCVLGDHSKSRKHNEAVQDAKMRNVTAKAVLKEVMREGNGLTNTFRLVLWLARGHCPPQD